MTVTHGGRSTRTIIGNAGLPSLKGRPAFPIIVLVDLPPCVTVIEHLACRARRSARSARGSTLRHPHGHNSQDHQTDENQQRPDPHPAVAVAVSAHHHDLHQMTVAPAYPPRYLCQPLVGLVQSTGGTARPAPLR